MTESFNNNRDGKNIAEEVFNRLSSIGNITNGAAGPTNDRASEQQRRPRNGSQPPPHNIPRHPEDPPGALADAAREVCDPETIRVNAVSLGKGSQAIGPELFEDLVQPLYERIHQVRAGAIRIPAQLEAGGKLKFSAGTEAEVARILAEGDADGEQADRLEKDVVPRVERELDEASEECEKADQQVESAQHEVDRRREQKEHEEAERPNGFCARRRSRRLRSNLFGRVSFSPAKASLAFAAEVVGSTFILAPNVADIANTSFEYGVLIAFAISVALLAASFAAGMALAAIRLPGWLVGLILLGIYAAILVKFIPGLDALREAGTSGVETLTAATLAACFIAALTGYVLATSDDQREELAERAEQKRAGTRLGDALDNLDEAKKAVEQIEGRAGRTKQVLAGLWEQIEQLRDSASRAHVTALERVKQGIEAEVEVGTIQVVANSGVSQERAAAEWAIQIALLAHEKARVEKVPENGTPDTAFAALETVDASEQAGLTALQKAALGTLGVSGIGGLVLGAIPLGIGASAVALMILLDQRSRPNRKADSRDEESVPEPPSVVPPAFDDSQFYVRQPDRMRSKHHDGGAGVGERQ